MEPVIVAYVSGGSAVMPDVEAMTHINFAFGHVNASFDGVSVPEEAGLARIAALKRARPALRVLLSIGGWTAGGFSEMAREPSSRAAFAASCARFCDRFALDGIDMDWEYPTSCEAGIAASPSDRENFTLLMRELRGVLGGERLLTMASYAGALYVDFRALADTLDFVNVMAYDLGRPPFHNAPLRASAMTRPGGWTCESAVQAHLDAGLAASKIVLGVPFYGHGDKRALPDFVDYKDIEKAASFTRRRDPVAEVPYLTDAEGAVVCVYDDVQSLTRKCEAAREAGLRGMMYWEYACDNAAGDLREAVKSAFLRPGARAAR